MRVRGLVVIALLAAGCEAGSSEETAGLPVVEEGNFTLYVTNQSFAIDPVDIEVRIDGNLAVRDEFEVGAQHSFVRYGFELTEGLHVVTAVTERGEAELAETFVLPRREQRYGLVSFWFHPPGSSSEETPRQLAWSLQDEPFVFD